MQHSANDMDERGTPDLSKDPQVQRIFRKLAHPVTAGRALTPTLPRCFRDFPFDVRLVAGITPIEKDGPLDFYIDRPNGMPGYIINLTLEGKGRVFDGRIPSASNRAT